MTIREEIAAACAEVATWQEHTGRPVLDTFDDEAILGALNILEDRLAKLRAYAALRGLTGNQRRGRMLSILRGLVADVEASPEKDWPNIRCLAADADRLIREEDES